MLTKMRQTIEVLKNRVALNLEGIKKNEIRFKQILNEGKAVENADELSALLENNKVLLSENFDYINVQLSMLKFLGRYKSANGQKTSLSQKEIEELHQSMDIFRYTINGKLPFNAHHPMLFDENFCARLMNHYSEIVDSHKRIETLKTWSLGHLN
jgi:hypothetical protein